MNRFAGRAFALVAMAASGFAALGYQMVWTQQAALWLGHESAAVLAVVAAFFGGLSLGALALGPTIDRSQRPAHWYVACELVIGLWGVTLALQLGPLTAVLLRWIGAQPSPLAHWSIAFAGVFLLLLPATVAMGATLPAMERLLAQWQRDGANIPELYAANTVGAMLGVLACAFWLLPQLGLTGAALVCLTLNALSAGTVLWLGWRASTLSTEAPRIAQAHAGGLQTLATLVATGLLGIGYEVVVVRALSQVAENTVYTFALLLAVYLGGTALGATLYSRWLALQDAKQLRDRLLLALAAACGLGMASLWSAAPLHAAVSTLLGPGMAVALLAEGLPATLAFLLPTVVMGALFVHLATAARRHGNSFGRAIGVNTAGAATAPLLFGALLMPLLGVQQSLLLIIAGYLALASARAWRRPATWIAAGATVAVAIAAPSLAIIDVPPGGRIVSAREGALATVSVVADRAGVLRLRINNRQQEGASDTRFADGRQALLPLLLQASPQRALFLGLGTGVTASVAAADPQLHVDAVELLPEVIEASMHFRHAGDAPLAAITADARRFVRASAARYDIIVADNVHPARSGSAALYTVEHYRAVEQRLAPGGIVCQWLPLHQLDMATLQSIVRSFLVVFPQAWAVLATNSLDTPVLGLVAHAGTAPLDVRALGSRMVRARAAYDLGAFGLHDELAVLGSFVAGPLALARLAAGAPLNTDDHPVVAHQASRAIYGEVAAPRQRLLVLLQAFDSEPRDRLLPDGEAATRMQAYQSARNRFIATGAGVRPSADVRVMLAQVQRPLLEILRISPEFRPAYDPLLAMAQALAPLDTAAARSLLAELAHLQPERAEAGAALRALAVAQQ
jgi:spermidine synthase